MDVSPYQLAASVVFPGWTCLRQAGQTSCRVSEQVYSHSLRHVVRAVKTNVGKSKYDSICRMRWSGRSNSVGLQREDGA